MTENNTTYSGDGNERITALVVVPGTAATHVPGAETTGAIDAEGNFVEVHPEYVINDKTGQVTDIRPWEPDTSVSDTNNFFTQRS